MAKTPKKKAPKEASNVFHSIMAASVKDNPKPKNKDEDFESIYGKYEHLMVKYIVHFKKDGTIKSYSITPFVNQEEKVSFTLKYSDMPPNANEKEIREFIYDQSHSRNWIQNPKKRECLID